MNFSPASGGQPPDPLTSHPLVDFASPEKILAGANDTTADQKFFSHSNQFMYYV